MKLAYCDKIADTIRKALVKYDTDGILNGPVGPIKSDLDPRRLVCKSQEDHDGLGLQRQGLLNNR